MPGPLQAVATPPGPISDEEEAEASKSDEHAYSVNLCPPSGEWVDLKNGIKFMR